MPINYQGKPFQTTPIINLASKMDNRSNNEVLDLDPNNTSLICTNLENADLFNSKAIASRLGTTDVCGGMIGQTNTLRQVFPVNDSLPNGTWNFYTAIPTARWDYTQETSTIFNGNIIIPDRTYNIYSGNANFIEQEVSGVYLSLTTGLVPQINYDVDMRMTIIKLNQVPTPISGVYSFMSGIGPNTSGVVHNISTSGVQGFPPYPSGITSFPFLAPTLANFIPEGVALTRVSSFKNFLDQNTLVSAVTGYYTGGSYGFISDVKNVSFVFNSPVTLLSGAVYFAYVEASQTSGTIARNFAVESAEQSVSDLNPQLRKMRMTKSSKILLDPDGGFNKNVLLYNLFEYVSPSYTAKDFISSNQDVYSPLVSGDTFMKHQRGYNGVRAGSFIPTTMKPPVPTDAVEFGEVFTLPSGNYNIFGGYFFAAPNEPIRTNPPSNVTKGNFTRNGVAISGISYNLGYAGFLSSVDSHTGSINGGNYNVTARTILASYSGNQVFNQSDKWFTTNDTNPNYQLSQLAAVFNQPAILNLTANTDFLLSWKYFDFQTDGPYTDYSYYASAPAGPPPLTQSYTFSSFMREGFQTQSGIYSGAYVINSNNDSQTFIVTSGNGYNANDKHLACGLFTYNSGSAITSIYDYRIGFARSQRVIYTQDDKINYFTLQSPAKANHVTICSGMAIGDNHKWSHATLQNYLFSTQYSQSTPQTWDQIYSNPSGWNSTQVHGLRPTFNLFQLSGLNSVFTTGIYASGSTIQVMIATQMGTGGIRASLISGIVLSGNNMVIGLSGLDIFNTGISPALSQYHFDALPQSTYVFATKPSGNVFYLAGLVDNHNNSAINPRPNTYTFQTGVVNNIVQGDVYISNISDTVLTQEIPNITNYNQTYLTDQVDVPRVKKWLTFKNYLIGAGDPDNNSRLWFSEVLAPQIFGTDGIYCTYLDLDIDDGSPITGMEIFRDRLLVFKYNSFYLLTYTGDSNNPFQAQKMSSTIGNLGFFDTVTTDYGVFGLSQYGPFLATNAGIDTIGDEIIPYFKTLDHTDLTYSVAIRDRLRQQIYWSITVNDTSPDNTTGLTYSFAEKAWNIRKSKMWNSAGVIGDEDNFDLLFTGDKLGQIHQLDSGEGDEDVIFISNLNTTVTKNITLVMETPWLSFGKSEDLKQLKSLKINCDKSEQRLRIDVYFDQDEDTIQYTRYLNMDVPVINRVVSMAGTCRTLKLVFTSVGEPDLIKLNSLQLAFQSLGQRSVF